MFPVKNNPEPDSLWRCFYPRSKMKWEWDESGDNRVAELWHLREALSRSRKVVYTKWYQGRATFFSLRLFTALLSAVSQLPDSKSNLSAGALAVLGTLEDDSPLPTKELRAILDMTGRHNEARFSRALRELYSRLLIVGYGEVEEGGFPSLAIGATRLIFEELWDSSKIISAGKRESELASYMPPHSPFHKQLKKLYASISGIGGK